MKISKIGEAGAAEASDILITAEPNDGQGIVIDLTGKSVVMKQFGRQIRETIQNTLAAMDVTDAKITAKDNGALDYTIRARVRTAVSRAV